MSTTFIHDRKKRLARQATQARTELTDSVKVESMNLVSGGSIKSRGGLPKELISIAFDELTVTRRISILKEYIDRLRELGERLSKEYGDIQGARDELSRIEDRINAAGEMIIRIELENVKPKVPSVE